MDSYLASLVTEKPNANTEDIDQCSTVEMLRKINDEDEKVAPAVREEIPKIAEVVDEIAARMQKGGRLFYFGAGTSGRLGVLDASECPPTYGVSPELVQGYIAGGDRALRLSAEGCEDNPAMGEKEVTNHKIGPVDTVVGLTASGRAPYVIGVIDAANRVGAYTVGIATNENSILSHHAKICITPLVGSEVVMGSTRMKSGTAQKLVLNMISTSVMIKLGKVYGNLMVDVRATNEKLVDRAKRIFLAVTGAESTEAETYLKLSGMDTKLALTMYLTGRDREQAKKLLDENGGFLRGALQEARLRTTTGEEKDDE